MTYPKRVSARQGKHGEEIRQYVFLSSRFSELATERRYAFEACSAYGAIPLSYETEPRHVSERRVIDALVDRCDYFIGIYYHTIGAPTVELARMCGIEYEFYRFLRRLHERVFQKPEAEVASRQLSLMAEDDMENELRDAVYRKTLKQMLCVGLVDLEGFLAGLDKITDRGGYGSLAGVKADVLRSRTVRHWIAKCDAPRRDAIKLAVAFVERALFLLRRSGPVDAPVSREMMVLLDGLRPVVQIIEDAEQLSPPLHASGADDGFKGKASTLWLPVHFSLVEKVKTFLDREALAPKAVDRSPTQYASIRLEVQDRPGQLARILKGCFSAWLNVVTLRVQLSPSKHSYVVELFCVPFIAARLSDSDRKVYLSNIRKRIESSFDDSSERKSIRDNTRTHIDFVSRIRPVLAERKPAHNGSTDQALFKIKAVNVPGVLSSICQLTSSWEMNITSIWCEAGTLLQNQRQKVGTRPSLSDAAANDTVMVGLCRLASTNGRSHPDWKVVGIGLRMLVGVLWAEEVSASHDDPKGSRRKGVPGGERRLRRTTAHIIPSQRVRDAGARHIPQKHVHENSKKHFKSSMRATKR